MAEKGLWERLVDSKWAEVRNGGRDYIPSDQEAITGAKRLWRKALGKPFRGPVKITSGNRQTWMRYGTLYVNPSEPREPGWPGIVHSISHLAHNRLNRGDRPHSDRQAYIERDLTDYAIANGFHLGKLKRPEKAKPERDIVKERYQRILVRERNWQAKLKRAQTAVRKVAKERREYERRHGDRLT